MKVKFIIPIPDTDYYIHQVLIQINNFAKLGYDIDAHYLIGVVYGKLNEHVRKIADSSKIKAKFHFYIDGREAQEKSYSASLKPYLVYRYFQQHPWEKDCAYVYLDPDVIFLEKFDFTPYLNDDKWYGSDVASYIDSSYIKQKGGDEFLKEFTEHAGVSPELIIAHDKNCIGAQYITKNNTPEYWLGVYKKSAETFNYINTRHSHYFKKEMIHWLQVWTMEMWITLWELWRTGVETIPDSEWEFHWANHLMKDKKHKIFHNAGIAEQDQSKAIHVAGITEQDLPKIIHYAKRAYEHQSPFNKDLPVSEESMSYLYVKEIKEVEVNYPDLVWD